MLITALVAGVAAALLTVPHGRPALPRRPRVRPRHVPSAPWLLLPPVGAAAVLAHPDLPGTGLGLGLVALVVVLGAARLVAEGRRVKAAAGRRQQVVEFAEALVGELRAGQPPTLALRRAVEAWPEAAPVVAAAGLGGEVGSALREVATRPGAAALRRLAAAWQLCEATGAGLAGVVEQVVAALRAEQRTARLLDAELSAARATARLVCGLPVVVLLAGQGAGARPWHFLTGTLAGVCCLGAGVVLGLGGLLWLERIAASIAGQDP